MPVRIPSLDDASNANLNQREHSSQSLHWLSQALESSTGVLGSANSITVVDAPSFFASDFNNNDQSSFGATTAVNNNNASSAILENFYSNLIEIVDPSLILFIDGSNGNSSNMMYGMMTANQKVDDSDLTQEAKAVKQIVDKLNQNSTSPIEFVALESFVPPSPSSSSSQQQQQPKKQISHEMLISECVADRVEDYFCGPPSLPMKCVKIVVPLNKISFLTISKSSTASTSTSLQQNFNNNNNNNSTNNLIPSKVDLAKHARSLVGRVCAVSLAAVESETPYANVAGLVLVESIDVNENEAVLFAPAGGNGADDTCLVRPWLLVGDSRLTYHLHLNDSARGMDTVEANSI